jgi:hypothetical protein
MRVLNGNFVFDLCNFFQEWIPGIKQDLLVLYKLNCAGDAVATLVGCINH